MGQILRIEIGKAVRTKGFYFALCAGLFIALFQTVWFYQNVYKVNNDELSRLMDPDTADKEQAPWFETGILQGWMGCEIYSPCNQLFYLLFPLLAALPYGAGLYQDWDSGYICQMLTRCGRRRYFSVKMAAAFVSGGTVVLVPLLVNLILTACYLPAVGTDPLSMQAVVSNRDMWAVFFYGYPLIYALLYSVTDFIYGGIYACIALVVTHCFDSRFPVVAFPLLLHCCLYYGLDNLVPFFKRYNISDIINPAQLTGVNRWQAVLATAAVLMAVLVAVYAGVNTKKDILRER